MRQHLGTRPALLIIWNKIEREKIERISKYGSNQHDKCKTETLSN
jgi:hypothetical protein